MEEKFSNRFRTVKSFLLAANFDVHEVAELKNKAAHLMQEHPVLFLNRAADQNRLLLVAEKPFQLLDRLLGSEASLSKLPLILAWCLAPS